MHALRAWWYSVRRSLRQLSLVACLSVCTAGVVLPLESVAAEVMALQQPAQSSMAMGPASHHCAMHHHSASAGHAGMGACSACAICAGAGWLAYHGPAWLLPLVVIADRPDPGPVRHAPEGDWRRQLRPPALV